MSARANPSGAIAILRRGLRETPQFKTGFAYTIGLALFTSLGAIIVPILVQQVVDNGLMGPRGFRPGFVYRACALTAVVVMGVYVTGRATYARMVRASQEALAHLRVKTFAHIHSLSFAEQTERRRGTFVARVTSDIETLSEFMQWGALAWVTSSALLAGSLIAMLFYSWRLTIVVVVVVSPLYVVLRRLQRGLLAAYDNLRSRVADLLTEVSESVMGAAVIRAYGLEERTDRRLKDAIARRYDAQIHANRYQATIFPVSDVFGAVGLAAAVGVGVWTGAGWGLTSGRLIAFAFLVGLFVQPLSELSETFDQTQTAIAAWRKVLGVLDLPVDLEEPSPGVDLVPGPLAIETQGLEFAYRDGPFVLQGIDVSIPAGAHVAVVGQTGCGKTTFAKLLCRLADPTSGSITMGGIDLRLVAPESRRAAIRMVPQDGFLFDATVGDNIRYGRAGATDAEVAAVIAELGLGDWVGSLAHGLNTHAGERGNNLSVGERQIVALARAQISSPGLLILDEATSAVDPETERALSEALQRASRGRTTLTIAHRMSTAEVADLVLVFDRGRIAERGTHASLAAAGGIYASLYRSWLGNIRGAG